MATVTQTQVEEIISAELATFKTSLMEKLTSLINEKIKIVTDRVDSMEKTMKDNYDSLLAKIEHLEKSNNDLRRRHARDVVNLYDLEIHSRKRNVIIANIEESPDPNSETTDVLLGKFKTILKDSVKMDSDYVDSFTFAAAHRLGAKKDKNQPRSTIVVFDKSYHAQDMWKKVKTLGAACKYHLKTHLPTDLAMYKSDLLQERIRMRRENRDLPVRVVEVKGYPQMEVKTDGSWNVIKAFKDRFNGLLDQPIDELYS